MGYKSTRKITRRKTNRTIKKRTKTKRRTKRRTKKINRRKSIVQYGGMPSADVNNVYVVNSHGGQCLHAQEYDEFKEFDSYYFTMPAGIQLINFGDIGSSEQVSGLRDILPELISDPNKRDIFIKDSR